MKLAVVVSDNATRASMMSITLRPRDGWQVLHESNMQRREHPYKMVSVLRGWSCLSVLIIYVCGVPRVFPSCHTSLSPSFCEACFERVRYRYIQKSFSSCAEKQ